MAKVTFGSPGTSSGKRIVVLLYINFHYRVDCFLVSKCCNRTSPKCAACALAGIAQHYRHGTIEHGALTVPCCIGSLYPTLSLGTTMGTGCVMSCLWAQWPTGPMLARCIVVMVIVLSLITCVAPGPCRACHRLHARPCRCLATDKCLRRRGHAVDNS